MPENSGYTMKAGYFLSEVEKIPQKGVFLTSGVYKLTVEKTSKQNINLLRTELDEGKLDESRCQK